MATCLRPAARPGGPWGRRGGQRGLDWPGSQPSGATRAQMPDLDQAVPVALGRRGRAQGTQGKGVRAPAAQVRLRDGVWPDQVPEALEGLPRLRWPGCAPWPSGAALRCCCCRSASSSETCPGRARTGRRRQRRRPEGLQAGPSGGEFRKGGGGGACGWRAGCRRPEARQALQRVVAPQRVPAAARATTRAAGRPRRPAAAPGARPEGRQGRGGRGRLKESRGESWASWTTPPASPAAALGASVLEPHLRKAAGRRRGAEAQDSPFPRENLGSLAPPAPLSPAPAAHPRCSFCSVPSAQGYPLPSSL